MGRDPSRVIQEGEVHTISYGSYKTGAKSDPAMEQIARAEQWPASGPCADDFRTG